MTPEEKKAHEAEQKRIKELDESLAGIADGTEKTLATVTEVSETVTALNEKVISMEEAIALSDKKFIEADKRREAIAEDMDVQGKKITGLRGLLNHEHGKSGAVDVLNLFGKWMKGCYYQKRDGNVPDEFKIPGYDYEFQVMEQKSATTQTDSNAGFLIPEILHPELQMTEDIYGNLLPLIRQIPMTAGSTVKINEQATKANANWRCAECTAIPTSEILLSQQTLDPCLLGDITPVSQEMFHYPGTSFAEIIADNVARSIVGVKETAILQADSTVGGAQAPPSDGVLVASGVNDIAAGLPAAATLADYLTFIGTAVVNYPHLMNTGVLFIPILRYFNLVSELVNKSCSSPAWDAMKPGAATSPLGFPALMHQGMTISTTDWAAFLDPKQIMGGGTSGMAIDVNPWGTSWSSHCIDIKLYTYFDYKLMNKAGMSKGDFAAA